MQYTVWVLSACRWPRTVNWVESRRGAVARGAPFPRPAHRTGRADLPHPALGEEIHACAHGSLPFRPCRQNRPSRWRVAESVNRFPLAGNRNHRWHGLRGPEVRWPRLAACPRRRKVPRKGRMFSGLTRHGSCSRATKSLAAIFALGLVIEGV